MTDQPTKTHHDMKCAWYPTDQEGSPFSDSVMSVLLDPTGEPWASCVIGFILNDPNKDADPLGPIIWLRAEPRAWAAFRKRVSTIGNGPDGDSSGQKAMAVLDELRAGTAFDYVRISL